MILSVLFGVQFNEAKHHSLCVFKKRLHCSLNDIQWCCIQETNSLATIEKITAWRPFYICLSFLCVWEYKLDKFFKNLENIESVLEHPAKMCCTMAFTWMVILKVFVHVSNKKQVETEAILCNLTNIMYHKLRCIWQTPSLISKIPICDFNLLKSQRCGLVQQGE